MILANVEDQLLGFVQCNLGVALLVGDSGDITSRLDETAQDGGAFNDAPIVFDVAAGGNHIYQRGDVAGAAYGFELILSLQFVTDSNEIGWFVLLIELNDGL